MAIEKTNFVQVENANRLAEIAAWLNTNKGDLFDEAVVENSAVVIKKDNSAVVGLFNQTYFHAKGGAVSENVKSGNSTTCMYGIKTSKGLILKYSDATGFDIIFFCKSQNDKLALGFIQSGSQGSSSCLLYEWETAQTLTTGYLRDTIEGCAYSSYRPIIGKPAAQDVYTVGVYVADTVEQSSVANIEAGTYTIMSGKTCWCCGCFAIES